MEEKIILNCGCCGRLFKGIQTPEHDTGYGTCSKCKSWATQIFYKARREILSQTFTGKTLDKWKAIGEYKQNKFIEKSIKKGLMI